MFKTITKSAEIINVEEAYDQRISFLIYYIQLLFFGIQFALLGL